ncbi:hypothetical protein [Sulfurimonas sp.]|uniref:hypothetical protein n=1 Tax=Sulfurimonas sp. TaxID=2022749 RepID=UPI003D13FDD6
MKSKMLIAACIAAIISGCTSKHMGMSAESLKNYPSRMVAQSDIDCNGAFIPKGAVFGVEEIGGMEVYDKEDKAHKLPPEALLLREYNLGMTSGFVVYPNGNFVYQNYFFIMDVFMNGKFRFVFEGECKYSSEKPFKLEVIK